MENSKQLCPYCGTNMEWGAIASGWPLWWFVNPERTRWRLKADKKIRLVNLFSNYYKYGFRCHQCNLLIIDLKESE